MQYKVPQNVDIEDKVIAGLTLRQFAFLMGAGGTILVIKFLLPEALGFLFFPLAVVIAVFGLALAFYKINDRPFEIFLISAGKTMLTPGQRVWRREGEPQAKEEKKVVKASSYQRKQNLKEIKSNLEKLAMSVDSGVSELENRASNIKSSTPQESKLPDVLAKTENTTDALEDYMAEARSEVGKKKEEAPISSLASIDPQAPQFKYANIELDSERDMEQMLKAANEKQTEVDEKLKVAKINKFDHTK